MWKKRVLVLGAYLWLLALVACGPKIVDDSDIVSLQYTYSLGNGTVVEEWVKDLEIWKDSSTIWIDSIVLWARKNDEFEWRIDWKKLFGSSYNPDNVQYYPRIVIKEILWVSEPQIWMSMTLDWFGEWIVIWETTDDEWYPVFIVDFNDPKTYSELSYYFKVLSVKKQ